MGRVGASFYWAMAIAVEDHNRKYGILWDVGMWMDIIIGSGLGYLEDTNDRKTPAKGDVSEHLSSGFKYCAL